MKYNFESIEEKIRKEFVNLVSIGIHKNDERRDN